MGIEDGTEDGAAGVGTELGSVGTEEGFAGTEEGFAGADGFAGTV